MPLVVPKCSSHKSVSSVEVLQIITKSKEHYLDSCPWPHRALPSPPPLGQARYLIPAPGHALATARCRNSASIAPDFGDTMPLFCYELTLRASDAKRLVARPRVVYTCDIATPCLRPFILSLLVHHRPCSDEYLMLASNNRPRSMFNIRSTDLPSPLSQTSAFEPPSALALSKETGSHRRSLYLTPDITDRYSFSSKHSARPL